MAESTRGSVGIPLPGITIGVFDDDFNELPYYERGQILANTPCSMLGYYKNDKATEEYFHIDKMVESGIVQETLDILMKG